MQIKPLLVLLSLSLTTLSAPTPLTAAKRALTQQTYDQFSVSGGVAGNALAEVNAKFPVDLNNLAGVSASDLNIISVAAQISEQAEIATGGFNDAIAAAGGTGTTAGKALQNGKIKNKVLKLQTDVLRIMIEVAQGNDASASELTQQQTKLATNVKLDVAAKGQTSTAISFSGTD
jgi:hypothetical protein